MTGPVPRNMSESITIPPKQFTNWYEVLGVQPAAISEDLTRAYQLLTAKFRSDNKETGDARRLQEVKTAYEVLTHAERRKAFDAELRQRQPESGPMFLSKEFADDVDAEITRRLGILCLLYKQRKIDPIYPGLTVAQLETLMATPREELEFSFWYLKQKRLVLADDRSTITIMCEGIDFIEENLPRESKQKLTQPRRSGDVDRAA
jgi:curved DNA-binding protein CbpA